MEIREYIRIILKRGWIIALLAVILAGAGWAFSKLQEPIYRATLYLNAIPARLDLSVQQTVKNMLNNYSRQITSDRILAQVNDELQLDTSPDALRADFSVSPIESDFLIQIAVDSPDPIQAKNVADTAADIFAADIAERMKDQDKQDRVDVFVTDYAQPGGLYKPKWKINTLAAGVFGGLLGLVVVLFLEWVEADVIRSREDIERTLALPIVGAIPMVDGFVKTAKSSVASAIGQEMAKVREHAGAILKYAWIIVVLAVFTAGSAIIFSKLQRPTYRATLYLNAIPARLEWGIQQTIQNQLRYYGRQITSDQTLSRVDELLQLDMPPGVLREDVSVDPIESDLMIQIAVESYDPMLAKRIADTAADVFVQDVERRMQDQDRRDRVDVFVSDYARPGALFRPKWKINAMAGGVLGGLLGVIVVLFLRWLEADVIRSADDLARNVGVPLMGAIPALEPSLRSKGSATGKSRWSRPSERRLTLDSRS